MDSYTLPADVSDGDRLASENKHGVDESNVGFTPTSEECRMIYAQGRQKNNFSLLCKGLEMAIQKVNKRFQDGKISSDEVVTIIRRFAEFGCISLDGDISSRGHRKLQQMIDVRGRGDTWGDSIIVQGETGMEQGCSQSEGRQCVCLGCGKMFVRRDQGAEILSVEGDLPDRPQMCDDCMLNGSLVSDLKKELEKRPFLCTVCGKTYDNPGTLKTHQKTHLGERPFSCQQCGKAFKTKGQLKVHLVVHTKEMTKPCNQCGKGFADKEELEMHLKFHANGRCHCCEECGKTFKRRLHLVVHMRTHSGERPYSCNVCGKGFAGADNLKKHMQIHRSDRPYACRFCEKTYKLRKNCVAHLKTHMKERPRPHQCMDCGKTFLQMCNLKVHQRIHTNERPHTCNVCGKGFTQLGSLKTHLLTHSNEKPFVCNDCGKGFCQKSHLQKHEKKHVGEIHFTCDYCGQLFSERKDLEKHLLNHSPFRELMSDKHSASVDETSNAHYSSNSDETDNLTQYQNVHLNETALFDEQQQTIDYTKHVEDYQGSDGVPIELTEYGSSLESTTQPEPTTELPSSTNTPNEATKDSKLKVSLMTRLKTYFNVGQKPHPCTICDKSFAYRGSLKTHMMIHSGEKPFLCDICGKAFRQKGQMKTHMLLKHDKELSHVCQECGEAFSDKKQLNMHMICHLNEGSCSNQE